MLVIALGDSSASFFCCGKCVNPMAAVNSGAEFPCGEMGGCDAVGCIGGGAAVAGNAGFGGNSFCLGTATLGSFGKSRDVVGLLGLREDKATLVSV